MVMKLDKHSEEELELCRPGVGVIFMKVGDDDIRAIEFSPAINDTLRPIPAQALGDIHEAIEELFSLSRTKRKEVNEEVKKKLRWYLKHSIELQESACDLEKRSEDLLYAVDQYFTEDQCNAIWSDIWHDLDDLPAMERLLSAIRHLEVKREEVVGK